VVLPIRDENPTSRPAVVTLVLIAINVFVYFAVQPHTGSDAGESFLFEHAVIPCELTGGHPLTLAERATQDCGFNREVAVRTPDGVRSGSEQQFPDKNSYLAVLFSMFMHGSVAHLLGNMLFLWIFGNNVEDRMGPIPYLVFYLFTGAFATAAFVAFNVDAVVPLVGASGAIAGVMGAYIVWFPRARVLVLFGFFPLYLPAVFVLGLWFVLQFATNPNEAVAWQAHVGGFVAGALIALVTRGVFGDRTPRLRAPYGDDWDGGFRGGYPGRL
jgi:membrane associated rhomboid family serine protease